MPGSTGKPLRKVARRRRQAPPTRSEHATDKQRGRRLQLENERCWVGTLKNSSRSSSSGDPGGNVYLYFVNIDQYFLQDSKRKDVLWDNIEFRKGLDVHNIGKLVEKVIEKILRRSQRQSIVGI
ncbi:hypothetical protein Forpi1262_v017899 [Fusarium oxysporum f. sp. raphani]|uniref:Uncharacterized protein n=1 Tax=Fusarium oxysporum f. sp. raphani TaxID=96318 RepID=A0A8J5TS30_FUSOX|nr:hypothetical protein Forpi1262_v017899 [Fusarium oxysporum f. sp. raphani]